MLCIWGRKELLKAAQIEFCTQFGTELCILLFMYTKCETFKWVLQRQESWPPVCVRRSCVMCSGLLPKQPTKLAVAFYENCYRNSCFNLLLAVSRPAAGYVVYVVAGVNFFSGV